MSKKEERGKRKVEERKNWQHSVHSDDAPHFTSHTSGMWTLEYAEQISEERNVPKANSKCGKSGHGLVHPGSIKHAVKFNYTIILECSSFLQILKER